LVQQLRMILDPIGFLELCFGEDPGMRRVHFATSVAPEVILVNDPHALQEILWRDGGRGVSAPGELNGLVTQLVGHHSILLQSGAAHRRRRQLLTPPFHGERLRAYGTTIRAIASEAMAAQPSGMAFPARNVMQQITMRVILQAVFGLHGGERYRQLEALISERLEMRSGVLGSLLTFFPLLRTDLGPASPGGRIRRNDAATRLQLLAEIAERRAQLAGRDPATDASDILTLLLRCADAEGVGLSDDELHDELLTLLFAGHETTATALTWALYWIHSLPEVQATLRAELASLGGDSDPERIARVPYLTAVCQETLRIHPVAMLLFPRRVEEPVDLGGFRLEPGEVVMGCIQAVHQRPDLYPEPGRFRPERFLEREFGPTEFLPFGGGSRRCIGAALALYEMKLVLATVLGGWELERTESRTLVPRRRGLTLAPSGPIWLRHRPR
jgi:cytochrome P450